MKHEKLDILRLRHPFAQVPLQDRKNITHCCQVSQPIAIYDLERLALDNQTCLYLYKGQHALILASFRHGGLGFRVFMSQRSMVMKYKATLRFSHIYSLGTEPGIPQCISNPNSNSAIINPAPRLSRGVLYSHPLLSDYWVWTEDCDHIVAVDFDKGRSSLLYLGSAIVPPGLGCRSF